MIGMLMILITQNNYKLFCVLVTLENPPRTPKIVTMSKLRITTLADRRQIIADLTWQLDDGNIDSSALLCMIEFRVPSSIIFAVILIHFLYRNETQIIQ